MHVASFVDVGIRAVHLSVFWMPLSSVVLVPSNMRCIVAAAATVDAPSHISFAAAGFAIMVFSPTQF